MDIVQEIFTLLTSTPLVVAALAGVAWGIVGGALPGVSPSIAMALLLPFTYGMTPPIAIVLLGAVYVGAEYGGSIPAILIKTPGTNAAAATVIDGHAMYERGMGAEALGISLYSSVIGSLFGLVVLVTLTEPLARLALEFTPMSYFGLGILGLSIIGSLSGKSVIKGLAAGVLGLMVATIGTDPISGVPRFTFGSPELLDGVAPILVMVGLFAVSELLHQSSAGAWARVASIRLRLPGAALRKRLVKPQLIGGIWHFWKQSRKEEFGRGAPEGIAAPETANNVVAGTALIPVLSFGIPGSNSAAVLLGGLLIHGLVPGPALFEENGGLITALYTGLFVASVGLLLLGMLVLPVCLWLVGRSKAYLMAFIYVLIFSGVYSINTSLFDVAIVLTAGVAGLVMRMAGIPLLPMVLGVVLGFLVESNYRRSLVLSGGDYSIFTSDRICLGLLTVAALFVVGAVGTRVWRFVRATRG